MLEPNYLTELIEIGASALEQEDRFIAGCVSTNQHLYGDKDRPGGLLRFPDERYYQVIIRRALMAAYRYRVTTEEGGKHDFVLRERVGSEPLAIGEMKRWFAGGSEAEVLGIRADVARLRNCGVPGFIIIAAGWPLDVAEEQLEKIKSRFELTAAPALYRFRTIGWPEDRERREFALLGFDVR